MPQGHEVPALVVTKGQRGENGKAISGGDRRPTPSPRTGWEQQKGVMIVRQLTGYHHPCPELPFILDVIVSRTGLEPVTR